MEKGKLKYFSDSDCWKVVDKKGNKYDPDPCYLDIYFKNQCLGYGMIYNQEREPGFYVEFQDISFKLDRSQIYEIEFHYWEATF